MPPMTEKRKEKKEKRTNRWGASPQFVFGKRKSKKWIDP